MEAAPEAGPSPTTGSSGAGLAARAGLVNFTLVLNMLLVAADRPPVLQVLFVNTEAMLSMSCTTETQQQEKMTQNIPTDTRMGRPSRLGTGTTSRFGNVLCFLSFKLELCSSMAMVAMPVAPW